MPEAERLRITDPQRIRALAHPLRIELLDVLGSMPEATATECAERTRESVASCSFHLRMLAKYGYIESAEPRGREKPWRLISRSRTVTPDWDDPASVAASREFAMLTVEREAERLRSWVRRAADEPREWAGATAITRSAVWLTSGELAEVSAALADVTSRFKHRDDPRERPDGARLVHFLGATSIESEPSGDADRTSGTTTERT
jgi:DNA-binding transcriptional ArsR family regulator